MNCAINSTKMKKIAYLLLILFIFLIYGCGKEEAVLTGNIAVSTYKVEEMEVTEESDEERENVTTARLCHDTDNGIARWVNGSVFGFYDNATRFEFNDYCISNNYLMEFYCENEIAMQKVFLCKSGCTDSHCI